MLFEYANIFDFSAHSCCAASTTKAKVMDMEIDKILLKVCWSNVKTFYRHYDKIIVSDINTLNEII